MKTSERPRVFSLVCVSLSLDAIQHTRLLQYTRPPGAHAHWPEIPSGGVVGKIHPFKDIKNPSSEYFFLYKEAVPILFIKKTGSGWSTLFFLPEADAPTM